jgi:hypothetical protein
MAKYVFEKQEDYGLLKDGEYEVRLEKIEQKTTQNGKENLSLMFRVRDDVEQEFQNRVLFESIWKEKDTDFYNRKRLNQLIGTQHFEDGTSFESIGDIINELNGSSLIVVITTKFNDYQNKDENSISYYKSSNHLPKSLKSESKEQIAKEDDLPF